MFLLKNQFILFCFLMSLQVKFQKYQHLNIEWLGLWDYELKGL